MVAVWAALVAAGAVYVAALVVWPDNVPAPLIVHFTPAEFLSLATVAVSVAESVPSTAVADAVTVTATGAELPPQPDTPSETPNAPNPARSVTRLHILRPSAALRILIPPRNFPELPYKFQLLNNA